MKDFLDPFWHVMLACCKLLHVLYVQVLFDSVGGLSKHIRALKEMIVFPLLYPEIFVRFKIAPPRGVLFHGPPGMIATAAFHLHLHLGFG